MFFFCFFCFFQATILQLPRIFVKDDAQAAEAAGGAAEAAGARPAKPVAARLELEGEKRLPEGASWRWGEPGDEAKGPSADHKSALAKAEKAQGNTQRALDQALNLAAKRGEEVEAMREALREAQEGRRKAEVEAAQLMVEVEGQRRRGDDLTQRLGVAEAQVRSLTSTLCASFGVQQAQQVLAPQGLQSQGSGSRSGSQ